MQDLDIVNRALKFIGSHPAESMSDTDKNAARAIEAYAVCRDEVLRMAEWSCCIKRAVLWDCAKQATPWKASHRYEVGERVTNDTLKTYQCTTAGKSATSGGPTGTATPTDGTVVWTYTEASTALTNWCHQVLTPYELGEVVSWDTGRVYSCIQAGTSAAANQPEGTSDDIVDGTCRWSYYASIKGNLTIYDYQYLIPPDCKRILKIPLSTATTEGALGAQYLVEGRFLYTDLSAASLKYVWVPPVDEWDALLQGTVAFRLAAEIAFDITGQKDIQQTAFQAMGGQYQSARLIALGEGQETTAAQTRWEEV